MPLTLKATDGIFTQEAEGKLFPKIIESFLKHGGASGNPFIAPNMIGDGITIGAGRTFAGHESVKYVELQLKVPSFALNERAPRDAFVAEATDLILEAAEGRVERARVYINLIYGSGLWAIGGKVYSDFELQDAINRAAT